MQEILILFDASRDCFPVFNSRQFEAKKIDLFLDITVLGPNFLWGAFQILKPSKLTNPRVEKAENN